MAGGAIGLAFLGGTSKKPLIGSNGCFNYMGYFKMNETREFGVMGIRHNTSLGQDEFLVVKPDTNDPVLSDPTCLYANISSIVPGCTELGRICVWFPILPRRWWYFLPCFSNSHVVETKVKLAAGRPFPDHGGKVIFELARHDLYIQILAVLAFYHVGSTATGASEYLPSLSTKPAYPCQTNLS
ncbi:hypothetical protein B0H17DRAFT_1137455 [Mycena rosella]|uniref:Uncharacterized protein n=1 Tax=Mycena rosella TaxID=1033263 RepID=A0AAD7GAT3_MYCRO|nr:hypothetical protein B0H17DRAFT_1137455 [Mycena rosella]